MEGERSPLLREPGSKSLRDMDKSKSQEGVAERKKVINERWKRVGAKEGLYTIVKGGESATTTSRYKKKRQRQQHRKTVTIWVALHPFYIQDYVKVLPTQLRV